MALVDLTILFAAALFIIAALGMVAYSVSTIYLLGRLQTHHSKVYEDLVRLGIYVANWYDWIKVMPFIWRGDYLSIDDSEVKRWGTCAQTTLLISLCGLLCFFIFIAAVEG